MPEQLDISAKELALLQEKIRRTNLLKKEYLRHIHNPYRHATGEGGFVFDPALQRFNALRAGGYDYFKPTWKNGLWSFCALVVPIAGLYYLLQRDRDAKEALYRSGKVSYRDRDFKFQ